MIIFQMAGRFFLTGVQIGMIRALAKLENDKEIDKILDEAEENQYLGDKEDFEKTFKKKKDKK